MKPSREELLRRLCDIYSGAVCRLVMPSDEPEFSAWQWANLMSLIRSTFCQSSGYWPQILRSADLGCYSSPASLADQMLATHDMPWKTGPVEGSTVEAADE